MKTLVTGGTGFVGSHLVEVLQREGHEVVCLVRDEVKARRVFGEATPHLVRGQLDDPIALARASQGIDLVFHVAGLTAAPRRNELVRVNEMATRTLISVLERHAPNLNRLVYVSSLAATGPTSPDVLIDGSTASRPVSDYGWSKLAGEEAVRRSKLPWTVVRPPTVYGPRDREVFKIFRLVRLGVAPVFGSGEQQNSFVYATDLAEALLHCVSPSTVGQVYFPAHREVRTQRELIHEIARAIQPTSRSPRILPIPPALARAALAITGTAAGIVGKATLLTSDRARDFLADAWICSPSSLERDTGWEAAIDLAAGLQLTAQWYRAAGWL